jgi:Uma2 family endonuclease
MVQTPSKLITLDEFLQQPETQPAREYIDRQIIRKPLPQGEHSTLQGDLVTSINNLVKPNRIARAYPELRCTFGGRSIVPDISVFLWDRIPRNADGTVANQFAIAPDWTIEILSPNQSQTQVTAKILHCLEHGTKLGWLIDPSERAIFAHAPQQALKLFQATETLLPVPDFTANLHLTVGEIFGWLQTSSTIVNQTYSNKIPAKSRTNSGKTGEPDIAVGCCNTSTATLG